MEELVWVEAKTTVLNWGEDTGCVACLHPHDPAYRLQDDCIYPLEEVERILVKVCWAL